MYIGIFGIVLIDCTAYVSIYLLGVAWAAAKVLGQGQPSAAQLCANAPVNNSGPIGPLGPFGHHWESWDSSHWFGCVACVVICNIVVVVNIPFSPNDAYACHLYGYTL